LFGEVDWDVVKNTVLNLGIRYTDEKRDLDSFNLQGLPPFGIISLNTTDSISNGAVSWTAGLSKQFNTNTMGYIKASKGFKSGGFNADYLGNPEIRFEPEYALTYESGIKFLGIANRLRLNTAVFYTDYKDLQVSIFTPNVGGFAIKNAAAATIYGVEAELTLRPTNNFDIIAGLGSQKATFDRFPNPEGPGTNYDGHRIENAPNFGGSGVLQYTWAVAGGALVLLAGIAGIIAARRRKTTKFEDSIISGTAVLPMMIAPASRSRRTTSASCVRAEPCAAVPYVVTSPATSTSSLIAIGTPSNGSRSPAFSRSWAAAASRRAESVRTIR